MNRGAKRKEEEKKDLSVLSKQKEKAFCKSNESQKERQFWVWCRPVFCILLFDLKLIKEAKKNDNFWKQLRVTKWVSNN